MIKTEKGYLSQEFDLKSEEQEREEEEEFE